MIDLTHWLLRDVAVRLMYKFQTHYNNISLCINFEIVLRWIPENLTSEKSTFVQVMATIDVEPVLSRHMTSQGHSKVIGIPMYNRNIEALVANTRTSFDELYEWCLCIKLTINNANTKCILYHTKNKSVPQDFRTLYTGVMSISRVKPVN